MIKGEQSSDLEALLTLLLPWSLLFPRSGGRGLPAPRSSIPGRLSPRFVSPHVPPGATLVVVVGGRTTAPAAHIRGAVPVAASETAAATITVAVAVESTRAVTVEAARAVAVIAPGPVAVSVTITSEAAGAVAVTITITAEAAGAVPVATVEATGSFPVTFPLTATVSIARSVSLPGASVLGSPVAIPHAS